MKSTGYKKKEDAENKIRRVKYFKAKRRKKLAYAFFKTSCLLISIFIVSVSMSFKDAGYPNGNITQTPQENTLEPSITAAFTPTVQQTPTPSLTPLPEISITPDFTPSSEPTYTPTPTQKPAPKPTPSPAPTKAPQTNEPKPARLSDYGELTIQGMPKNQYESTLNYSWQEVTVSGEYQHRELDLYKKHSYADLTDFMQNLSRHEYVRLSIMGKSTQGRNIYHLEVDFLPKKDDESEHNSDSQSSDSSESSQSSENSESSEGSDQQSGSDSDSVSDTTSDYISDSSDESNSEDPSVSNPPSNPPIEKEIIMLSGHVHAREMATDLYILKQIADLLKKAQYDENVRNLLERVKIVAIPIVNPDGREIVYNSEKSTWKANSAGVDINRNFPSVNAGQRLWGVPFYYAFESQAGPEGYAGPYLGSESETKIMMQWFHKYAGKAAYYIDYHQMGRAFFVGENWDLLSREQKKWADAIEMNSLYNRNLNTNKYREIYNGNYYGINGKGSGTTDYALSIALGMKYSEKYGRMVYKYNNQDLLLIMFRDLNEYKSYRPVNPKFVTLTLEIGLPDSLGYTATARASFAKEYYDANHDKYLTLLMQMALR